MLVSSYQVNNANFNVFQNYFKKEQQKLDSAIYTTQKKFRITYYIIIVHTILNFRSNAWRERNCMKLSGQYQLACKSTSPNFQDDLAVILENPQNRVFPKILRKVKQFKMFYLRTC